MTELQKLGLSDSQKQEGNFVLQNQVMGTDDGFSKVNKSYLSRCKTIPETIQSIERQITQDYSVVLGDVDFVQDSSGVHFLLNGDIVGIDDFASGQFCNLVGLPRSIFRYYNLDKRNGMIGAERQAILLDCLRQARKESPGRDMVFRTSGGIARGCVTPSYSPISNVDLLEILDDIIPDGRVSHDRSSPFGLFLNILIPDTLRAEDDSDYGGMVRCRNSEIGKSSLEVMPSIFRAICWNGNIWGSQEGSSYSRKHVGISIIELRKELASWINSQIPLVQSHIDRLLASHTLRLETSLERIITQSCLDCEFGSEFAVRAAQNWLNHSKEKTSFGIQDAITRTGQLFNEEIWSRADEFGGRIIDSKHWESLNRRASALELTQVQSMFTVSV